jgi:hypothetical protein
MPDAGVLSAAGTAAAIGAPLAGATFGLSELPALGLAIASFVTGSKDWSDATDVLKQNEALWQGFNPSNTTDQATMAEQQGNYQTLLDQIRQGGMNATDRSEVLGILGKQQAQTKQLQEGVASRSETQGTATGTAGLVGQYMAEQQAGNEAATQGATVAGQALQAKIAEEGTAAQTGQGIQAELQKGNEDLQNANEDKIQGEVSSNVNLANAYLHNDPTSANIQALGSAGMGAASGAWQAFTKPSGSTTPYTTTPNYSNPTPGAGGSADGPVVSTQDAGEYSP